MVTDESWAHYRLRKQTVEPVFRIIAIFEVSVFRRLGSGARENHVPDQKNSTIFFIFQSDQVILLILYTDFPDPLGAPMFDTDSSIGKPTGKPTGKPIGCTEPSPHADPAPADQALTDPAPADQALTDPAPADQALAEQITTLAGHLNAAHYRFLKLLDRFDRDQGWAGPGIRSLAHWLNWQCGLGDLAAREKVRVARALRSLPLTDAAFEEGRISYSKVRAMTRVATAANEAELLNIARHGTAAHMERLVRAYRRCRQVEDAWPSARDRCLEERFDWFVEDDEMIQFSGRVSIEQGRLLIKALEAMAAEMDAEAEPDAGPDAGPDAEAESDTEARRKDVSAETSAEMAADAESDAESDAEPVTERDTETLEENVSAETSAKMAAEVEPDAESDAEPVTEPNTETLQEYVSAETSVEPFTKAFERSVSEETLPDGATAPRPAERRATALVHLAEHYLATGGRGARPLTANEAYQVFIHVNANDAHPDNRINGETTCYTEDRRCLAPHVVRQLACEASRRTVLENDRGEVLNIGRRSRAVPRRLAHALRIRDGGCRFPACGQRRWTDAHHIRHWADGGETSLDNLVTLCRYHHRALHRQEYRIERDAGGEPMFVDNQGERLPAVVEPPFWREQRAVQRVRELQAEHARRGLDIDETTAVTAWAGESMDYSTAIDWLLRSDGVVT